MSDEERYQEEMYQRQEYEREEAQKAAMEQNAHDDYRLSLVAEIDDARLRELAEAEREGRVVVLPCKIGDTLYIPNLKKNGFTHDHVCEQKVDDVIVSVCDKQGYGFDVFSEGDYVECYTDRAEAARALAEKGDDT